MKMRASSFLGLAVGERSIVCAEVGAGAGDRRDVRHAAAFPLPEGALTGPGAAARLAPTGQALAEFLKRHGFGANRAVVGVPARWLLAVERDLPPAAPDAASAMLRLQAERLAVSETGEMVFDYAGRPDANAARKVLLVGIPRQRVTAIEKLLDAAGIDVAAVVPSSLALAAEASGPVVVLGRTGAELVMSAHGTPRLLRHVSTPLGKDGGPPALGPLSSELARTVAMSGGATGNGSARDLVLWDGVGLTKAQFGELAGRVGMPVTPGDAPSMLRVGTSTTNGAAAAMAGGAGEFAPAISLALAGLDRKRLPMDFTRSRLAPPKVKRISTQALWGMIAGALLLTALVWLYWTGAQAESEAETVAATRKKIEGDVKTAKASIDTTNYGRGFFDRRTPVLDVLLEVTKTIQPQDPLWATGFTIRSTGTVTLSGRASRQDIVYTLQNRLLENKKFSKVSVSSINQEQSRGREAGATNFTITFTYNPLAGPPAPATPARR
ncbi:MAG TPA: PilN domain-containing protein [Tepidisphaeraceae bacterium]|nr:PilN domain-containing protein [Tepidisphaeraceae bacterium]